MYNSVGHKITEKSTKKWGHAHPGSTVGLFASVKILPKEVTIFPDFFLMFRFKYYKSVPDIKICLNEVQTHEQSHQNNYMEGSGMPQ